MGNSVSHSSSPDDEGKESELDSMADSSSTLTTSSEDEVSLTITFSSSTYVELKQLAGGEFGIGEALRNAISLSKWFNNTLKEGHKIFVKRKGKLHEVVKV